MNAWPNLECVPPIPNIHHTPSNEPVSHFCLSEHRTDYPLFFPITNGDDALALAVPLEIVAGIDRALERRSSAEVEPATHLPRDNLVLSLKHLILAHDIPNAH